MNSTIFIPQKIRVGYQERKDTYTGKLAYVIYYDQKNKLRKEQSWESWRSKKIEPEEFTNEPISGFVLNKKVGDYVSDWNHRQAYVRIYDPRNFEFEITISNLLYILENANSIKGKGLEGDFVYGWDGKDLILIPTESPDYVQLSAYSEMLTNPETIKGKDLVLGGTYLTNKNEEWIYLGRFNAYERDISKPSKKYFFQDGKSIFTISSLSSKIVKCVSAEPVNNYAALMDALEHNSIYSPVDESATILVEYTDDELLKYLDSDTYCRLYLNYYGNNVFIRIRAASFISSAYYGFNYHLDYYQYDHLVRKLSKELAEHGDILKLHEKYHFSRIEYYLKNGKILKGRYDI